MPVLLYGERVFLRVASLPHTGRMPVLLSNEEAFRRSNPTGSAPNPESPHDARAVG